MNSLDYVKVLVPKQNENPRQLEFSFMEECVLIKSPIIDQEDHDTVAYDPCEGCPNKGDAVCYCTVPYNKSITY